jgi:hypothetical protein
LVSTRAAQSFFGVEVLFYLKKQSLSRYMALDIARGAVALPLHCWRMDGFFGVVNPLLFMDLRLTENFPTFAPGGPSREFLDTYEWAQVRYQVLLKYRDKPCMACGRGPKQGVWLNVDHIKPRKTHPHLALSVDNCSGSHQLSGRLAIEHSSRPTIIDSGACVRPTLSAPEPTLLHLGSQSAHAGSHSLQRAGGGCSRCYTASFSGANPLISWG